jgi:hypothetical protein
MTRDLILYSLVHGIAFEELCGPRHVLSGATPRGWVW